MRLLKWAWAGFLVGLAPFLLPTGAVFPLPICVAYIRRLSPPLLSSAGVILPVLTVELFAYYAIGRMVTKRIPEQRRLSILLAIAFVFLLIAPVYTEGWMLFSLTHSLKTRWITASTVYSNISSISRKNPYTRLD